LFEGRFAVGQTFSEFDRESVERAVSITFRCSFGLSVCFFITFNLKVAWYPSNDNVDIAEFFPRARDFVV
jgi:hypothetical protein